MRLDGTKVWKVERPYHIMLSIFVLKKPSSNNFSGYCTFFSVTNHISFSQKSYEKPLKKLPIVANMFKTEFCYLFLLEQNH